MDYLAELRDKVRLLHGCEATHQQTALVKELFLDTMVWDGKVEVFALTGHPKAKRCYAWGCTNYQAPEKLGVVTVLEIPPVESPETAVRVSISAHAAAETKVTITPSSDDTPIVYRLEDWNRDLNYWSSREAFSPAQSATVAGVIAYIHQFYPNDPHQGDKVERMWWALKFVDSNREELIQSGAARRDSSGVITFPPPLVTALYRAFVSSPTRDFVHAVDLPQVLRLTKEDKDLSEGRS